ncbi:MAG: FAD-binding oxidoreductase [Alphaproteobacteria bacterium]|nr:FAD-binding oxidoreductase [Alphaproteobacteria bacterium]
MNELFAPGFKETPYWWEAAPPPDSRPKDLPWQVDVAIVGGGYCGLSAALELRRHGVEVLVLEAERIGFGASSRNGGMVSGGLKLASGDLARKFGAEKAAGVLEEAAGSLGFLEELIAREGIQCHYKRHGRFVGAHCTKAYEAMAARAEALKALTGLDAHTLPRERQREQIATDYYAGGMVADATGGLHPALYHQGLAAAARRAGATVVDGTRVESVMRGPDGFVVRTARGQVKAREVMVATNGYTDGAAPWLRRRLIPVASYIIATDELPPETIKRLIPNGRMLSDTNRVLHYYRAAPDSNRILFGGRASFRSVTPREAAPILHRFMCAIWPELATVKITHAWTGNVAFTFDFTPHIAVADGVHYAAGCQGSGVAMASYLGHRTALKIAGRANRPSAFEGLGFPTLPLYSGKPWFLPLVGTAYRVQDWLDRRAG